MVKNGQVKKIGQARMTRYIKIQLCDFSGGIKIEKYYVRFAYRRLKKQNDGIKEKAIVPKAAALILLACAFN